MKTIKIPKVTFRTQVSDPDGSIKEVSNGFAEFVNLVLRSCPSSKSSIDRIFDVGKLINKIKSSRSDELVIDNDEYKILTETLMKETFEKWEPYKNQQGYTPTGWESMGINPLSNEAMEYLSAIKEAIDNK